jgi:hypothetical protein
MEHFKINLTSYWKRAEGRRQKAEGRGNGAPIN